MGVRIRKKQGGGGGRGGGRNMFRFYSTWI